MLCIKLCNCGFVAEAISDGVWISMYIFEEVESFLYLTQLYNSRKLCIRGKETATMFPHPFESTVLQVLVLPANEYIPGVV